MLSSMVTFYLGSFFIFIFQAFKISDVMPNFSSHMENAVNALDVNKMVDENEFIYASRLAFDGVREIRRAVLLNKGRRTWTVTQSGRRRQTSV